MTIRTGKGGRYRYYACSTKARQGATACSGMAVPMEKLDDLVAQHLEERLLQPERLQVILAAILDRRQDRGARQRAHAADLAKRATEAGLRLKRLYDAIEAGVADLDDPALKDRIDSLKAIRDQARSDEARAQALLDQASQTAVTPQMLTRFAAAARDRMAYPAAASAATTCAPWPNVSRWRKARSGSSDRSPGCSRRSQRREAETQCPLRD